MTTRLTGSGPLNKPMLIMGIDPKMAGLAMGPVALAIATNSVLAEIAAGGAFIAWCWSVRRVSREDASKLRIMATVRRQRGLYDPLKGEKFRVVVDD